MSRTFKTLLGSLVSVALIAISGLASAEVHPDETVVPSDVEKVSVLSGDTSVKLSWEAAASDTVTVAGYKVYFGTQEVKNDNTNVYESNVDAGSATSTIVKDLTNGVKYFFAVTAYDAEKHESDNYSPYVWAVPMKKVLSQAGDAAPGETVTAAAEKGGEKAAPKSDDKAAPPAEAGPDTTAPTLKKAEALNTNQVRITFSEKVMLPKEKPETAFTIIDNYSYDPLKVTGAVADSSDATGASYILETGEQTAVSEYVITVGIEIEDLAGNPINSGTSDTAPFTGSALTKAEYAVLHPVAAKPADAVATDAPSGDAVAVEETIVAAVTNDKVVADAANMGSAPVNFTLEEVVVENDTTVVVKFSQPAVFSIDLTENFEITKKGDSKAISLDSILLDDNKKDVLITTILEPGVTYVLKAKSVVNEKGATLASGKDTYEFSSGAAVVADTTPPEDVANFVAKALKEMGAKLQWLGSKNSAGDLLEYIIYTSTDAGKTYGKVVSLGKDATAYEVKELQPGEHYFKVTAKDETGNESQGKMAKVKIVETGPGIGLLALASLGLGRLFGRKKRK